MATKRENYVAIVEFLNANGGEAEWVECIEKDIVSLDNKNAKAKERQAAKKAAGDDMRDAVLAILTDEPQSVAEIMEQMDPEMEATDRKVIFRLGQLIDLGHAVKEQAKEEYTTDEGKTKSRKITVYSRA